MAYKLRFVQKFEKAKKEQFLQIEKKFIDLENAEPDFPIGKRFLPKTGREAINTLIWEAEFRNMEDAISALQKMEESSLHNAIFSEQVKYMTDTYTEIYEEFIYN